MSVEEVVSFVLVWTSFIFSANALESNGGPSVNGHGNVICN